MSLQSSKVHDNVSSAQCDQIGRFIGLWTTFQSLWQQLICPNLLHSWAIFVKVSKSLIFIVKSFLGNFYRHLVIFYWSHWFGVNKVFLVPAICQSWASVFFTLCYIKCALTARFCSQHKLRRNQAVGLYVGFE